VQAYLAQYVLHCGLTDLLRLNTEVVKATLTPEGKWQLLTLNLVTQEKTQTVYDYLVVCGGVFSIPKLPDYPGIEEFKQGGGKVFHTSQFNVASWAKGQQVGVVGYGKSACDLASAVAGEAASVQLIARHLLWKAPRKLFNVIDLKLLLLTRFGENLFPYKELAGPARFLHGVGRPIRNMLLGGMQAAWTRQQKLKARGLLPSATFESLINDGASQETIGFFDHVKTGAIKVQQTEIQKLGQGKAFLANGQEIPLDILICGTGWRQELPFLEPDVVAKIFNKNGDFQLYRNKLPFGIPNLMFNGYNTSFYTPLLSEIGALWIAEYISGGMQLPSEEVREKLASDHLAWTKERLKGKDSRGTAIVPFSMYHVDELLQEMGSPLPASKRFKQWFLPSQAADYQPIIQRKIKAALARQAVQPES
jgi:dimethylaniline monooxygenase (N-oxide forming)